MLTRLLVPAIALLATPAAFAGEQCPNKDHTFIVGPEIEAIRSGPQPVILIDDEAITDRIPVLLSLSLDVGGNVTCLEPLLGPEALWPEAVALARAWRFKPFVKDGTPVAVYFDQYVSVRWRSPRPAKRVTFPTIIDWSSLRIRLERFPCFMGCSQYTIEIAGDGTLTYEGKYGVAVRGQRTGHVGPKIVADLVDRFRKVDFFWLHDTYTGEIQDLASTKLTIAFDGHAKTVEDYVGQDAGMPPEITVIEREIDRLTNSKRWVGDIPGPVAVPF
jgi:Domain of unknown function (DUF6438)